MLKSYFLHTFFTMIIIIVSRSESVQNIESLLKNNSHTLSKIYALNSAHLQHLEIPPKWIQRQP